MSEWSPKCRKIFVPGSPRTGVGTHRRHQQARVRGLAGRRDLPAVTTATRLFAPVVGGAVVGSRWRGGAVVGGALGHDEELTQGIRSTLERIKASVEAEVPATCGASRA